MVQIAALNMYQAVVQPVSDFQEERAEGEVGCRCTVPEQTVRSLTEVLAVVVQAGLGSSVWLMEI